MGLNASISQAEEEADAMILANQNNPTLTENTGDAGTLPNLAPGTGTPEAKSSDSELVWEQKYKVLQGKYNAEVVQAGNKTSDDSQMYSENMQLKSQLRTMQGQLDAKSQVTQPGNDASGFLAEEYGEEFTKAIDERIASQQAGTHQQVQNMQEANHHNQTEMRKATLTEMLKAQGIDFVQVDNDPMFHQWLADDDGNTRQKRQTFLHQNFAAGDLSATAAYYIDFKAHERSSFKANPLDNHVDVSASNGTPDAGAEPDIWTTADMERLYDDFRRNRIDEATFNKFEHQLFRAQEEGRFRT